MDFLDPRDNKELDLAEQTVEILEIIENCDDDFDSDDDVDEFIPEEE